MATLRSPEMQEKYDEWKVANRESGRCILCEKEPGKTFTYWKIFPNDFPYDRITQKHDMIAPLRHVAEGELSPAEEAELDELKNTYINKEYEAILEPTHRQKTVPDHFHLQLIVVKE